MKSLLLVSATIFSLSTFAGGSGGGGILTQMRVQGSPEIVFSLGQKGDSIRFAHGVLLPGGWKVQKIEIPEAAVSVDAAVFEALLKSEKNRTWEVVK